MARVTAAVLASALAVALVLVQPWVGRYRYRRLLAASDVRADARRRHYRRAITGEWAVSALILVIGALAGRDGRSIGLVAGAHGSVALGIVAVAAAILGVSAAVFFFGGPGIQTALQRQARGFRALLPRTAEERLWFAALAVTAGICEELIFRGFGIAYLRWLWPAAPDGAVIAITAVGFGLAHLYQGIRGIVLTAVVGAYLAWTVLVTGSLWPAMAIHALLDLRVLALRDPDRSTAPPTGALPTGAPPAVAEVPAGGHWGPA